MKKAFNISIAGTLFNIEEDAFDALSLYLDSIRKHFAAVEGKEEIIRDIEARIAEQLLERGSAVIAMKDVDAVMASMGRVQDFDDGAEGTDGTSKDGEDAGKKPRRKLYRDIDNEIVGGVCAGLAKYFDIDVLWLRIAFVALVCVTGIAAPIYLVLWLLVPPAETASQKLEMEGEAVTAESIGKTIKEKAEDIKRRAGPEAKDVADRMKDSFQRIAHKMHGAHSAHLARVGPAFRRLFGSVLGFLSFVLLLALSFAATTILTNLDNPAAFGTVAVSAFATPLLAYCFVIGAYLALAIPLAVLFVKSIGLFQHKKIIGLGVGLVLLFVWTAGVVTAGVSGLNLAQRYQSFAATSPLFVSSTRPLDIRGWKVTSVAVKNGIRVHMYHSDTPTISMSGYNADLDQFNAPITSDGLITFERVPQQQAKGGFCLFCPWKPITIELGLPGVTSISISDGSRIDGIAQGEDLTLSARDGSHMDLQVSAATVSATARDGSYIGLTGTASSSALSAADGSSIEASGADFGTATIDERDGSRVEYDGPRSN